MGNRFSKNSEKEESSDKLLSSMVNFSNIATKFVQDLL